MSTHTQRQFVFHGAVILLGGMLAGFPLAVAIARNYGAQDVHAWAVTHTSLVGAGILLIAIGAAMRQLALTDRQSRLLPHALLFSVYALCVGLVVSAITGHRGMAPDGSTLNLALCMTNVAGVVGALFAGVLLVRGSYTALHGVARAVEHDAVVGGAA
jgi:hypothetical protein